jgi:hypothetical protein
MAVEDADDLAIFFDTDDFGVVATITPNDGSPFSVEGLFDMPHSTNGIKQANGYSNQADLSGQKPTFRARTIDLPGVRNGRAALVINGVSYLAHDVKPDGFGSTTIQLMKA